MVKRYDYKTGFENREYVLFEDYAALALKLEAAEASLNDEGVHGDHNLVPSYEAKIAALEAELKELKEELGASAWCP